MKFDRRRGLFVPSHCAIAGPSFFGGGGGSDLPTPVIESTASNIFNAGTTDTSCVMTMPAGIVAGNLLLHHYAYNNFSPEPVIGASGWTILFTLAAAGNRGMMVAYRVATGSDSLTVTNDSGRPSGGRTWRISGAGSTIHFATDTAAGSDFPNLATGGIANYLWLVLSAAGVQASTAPTDFGSVETVDVTFGGPKLFKAQRAFRAATLDPAATDTSQDKLATLALSG